MVGIQAPTVINKNENFALLGEYFFHVVFGDVWWQFVDKQVAVSQVAAVSQAVAVSQVLQS